MSLKTKDLKPKNINVLVSVELEAEKDSDGMFTGGDKEATKMEVEFYLGKVEDFGSKADSDEQCPGLKKGEYVIFSQFAGFAVATEDKYTKLIKGYDIIAKYEGQDMKIENIKPTADRVLVSVIEEALTDEDGMYIGDSQDPREKQTQKGEILAMGPGVETEDYKVGDIVYFDPYCGNLIKQDSEAMLKTINSFDILFTV